MKRLLLLAAFVLLWAVLLASPEAASTSPQPAPQDDRGVTMLFASDPQYPWWTNSTNESEDCRRDPESEACKEFIRDRGRASNQHIVASMNSVQSLGQWPSTLSRGAGAPIARPSGVILNGDLTSYFHKWEFETYAGLYYRIPGFGNGLDYQIYPGLGNHDYKNNVNDAYYSWAYYYWPDWNRNAKEAVWYMANQIENLPNVVNRDLNSYVSVKNSGGFVIDFSVSYTDQNGQLVKYSTDVFEVTQSRGLVAPRGTPVTVEIKVTGGPSWVLRPNPVGATCFEVKGTVFDASWAPIACQHERPTGSAGSLSYSFDIGNVHFVQLQYRPDYQVDLPKQTVIGPITTYEIDESPGFTVTQAYDWLKADLAAATAAGKVIVLNMHDINGTDCKVVEKPGGTNPMGNWDPCGVGNSSVKDDPRFKDAIANQNVVAIFAGHIHEQFGHSGYVDVSNSYGSRVPYFHSSSAECQRFLMVDFHRKYFNVAVVKASAGYPEFVTTSNDKCEQGWFNPTLGTQPQTFLINRPPTVTGALETTPALEGSSLSFRASGSDPDGDALTYTWDFGDGSPTASGETATHAYVDDGDYRVTVTADDGYGKTASHTFTAKVENVAPTITASGMTIDENGAAAVSITISDPGVLDSFELTTNWNDGSPQTKFIPAGTTSDVVRHQYLDDNPTGTPTDVYTVSLSIKDDGGTGAADTTVTVRNVAPTVRIEKVLDEAGQEVVDASPVLTGLSITSYESYSDVGTRDTRTATRSWGDATPVETLGAVLSNTSGAHVYQREGQYQLAMSVRDDDTGEGQSSRPIRVVTPSGATTHVINALSCMTSSNGTAARALADALAALQGNNGGVASNGALDKLAKGNDNAALVKLEQSIQQLETAQAADPSLNSGALTFTLSVICAQPTNLTRIKSLLTLTAKSVAVQAVARAEASARNNGQRQQVAAAKASLSQGQSLLNQLDYTSAIEKFREALSKTNFATG
ncbi:MAG TPA: PKD domain-containing protein [Pyrinomonadaceae bacterium]|nr:PKD domain-containing protein [Pyrinomonadaceae bacterium]